MEELVLQCEPDRGAEFALEIVDACAVGNGRDGPPVRGSAVTLKPRARTGGATALPSAST